MLSRRVAAAIKAASRSELPRNRERRMRIHPSHFGEVYQASGKAGDVPGKHIDLTSKLAYGFHDFPGSLVIHFSAPSFTGGKYPVNRCGGFVRKRGGYWSQELANGLSIRGLG